MTANEKQKIMDWIDKNTLHDPDFNRVVPVSTLTAFIESLPTEEDVELHILCTCERGHCIQHKNI